MGAFVSARRLCDVVARTDAAGLPFDQKVAIVTGGGSGIGRATALALARLGARVVIGNRRPDRGEETVALIRRAGGEAAFHVTDVNDSEEVRALVGFAVERYGGLHIAFNNAGFQEPRALLAEQPEEIFDRVVNTNLRGVYLCMKFEIPEMLQQGGGAIVNCASVSGLRNMYPGIALYSASKAAVVSLTKSAAMEYAQQGIRINAVAPGRILTDMLAGSGATHLESFAAGLPMRRLGTPEEVANAVVWLVSDEASFVTGHVVAVDGGFLSQ